MWALVRTFVPKDIGSEKIEVSDVLALLENALKESESGKSLLSSLDSSVERALARVDSRAEQFGRKK